MDMFLRLPVVSCFLALAFVTCANSYNVDISSATVLSSERNELFGFSVAFYKFQGVKRLIVGAPEAKSTNKKQEKTGAVFSCSTNGQSCESLHFDNKDKEKMRQNFMFSEDTSEQWLGATIEAASNGYILACAPRYVYVVGDPKRKMLIGQCYLSTGLNSVANSTVISPCADAVIHDRQKDNAQHDKMGKCQAGFSASFSLNNQRVFLGAVGTWYWQGSVFNYKAGSQYHIASEERMREYDYALMGYSVSVGKFDKSPLDCYSVGAPKAFMVGQVTILTQGLLEIVSFDGDQIGSFFGYSQTVGDFNGDSLDDLAVGAPFYSNYSKSDLYNQGRVYIYYQLQREFHKYSLSFLDGHDKSGQFGHSLASLGDINNDGFHDLCIGAPYGGESNSGVIYIYHGSSQGIQSFFSQKVTAESVSTNLRTFGFSLSSGVDIDDNQYPDILVGAYRSNKAILLRSRPIVHTDISLKADPPIIKLKNISCSLSNGLSVVCFQLKFCIEYFGLAIPDTLRFNLKIQVDSKKKSARANVGDISRKYIAHQEIYYVNTSSQSSKSQRSVPVSKHRKSCFYSMVFLKAQIRDKLSAMVVKFSFKLKSKQSGLQPVLDPHLPQSHSVKIPLWKDCGRTSKCIPDLALFSQAPEYYQYGDPEKMFIKLRIVNYKEEAYEAKMFIVLPSGLTYSDVNVTAVKKVLVTCQRDFSDILERVICFLGNPFPANIQVDMLVVVKPVLYVVSNSSTLDLIIIANSSNPEGVDDRHDNNLNVSIPVIVKPVISLKGASVPPEIFYNTSHTLFPMPFRHIYELYNPGPVPIKKSEILMFMPNMLGASGSLTSVVQPIEVVNGTASCSLTDTRVDNDTWYSHLHPHQTKQFKSAALTLKKDILVCTDHCLVINCDIGDLEVDQSFVMYVDLQLALDVLKERGSPKTQIVSYSVARVTGLHKQFTHYYTDLHLVTQNVSTHVTARDLITRQTESVPLWIIIVSVVAGLLLIILVIALLAMFGFFKRYRPPHKAVMSNPSELERLHDSKS